MLLNVNEFTELPRPTANIIRHIGGVAIREPQPLSSVYFEELGFNRQKQKKNYRISGNQRSSRQADSKRPFFSWNFCELEGYADLVEER